MILRLVREAENSCNRNSILVRTPSVNEVDENLLDKEVRLYPPTLVRDILNKSVGRVPANITSIIASGLDDGSILHAHAVYTGSMIHDGPDIGGGPKLQCIYFLEIDIGVNQLIIKDQFMELPSARMEKL